MPLNDLSYNELCHMRRMTDMLLAAYPHLRHLGDVHFDMTPGADVMVRIEARVPDLQNGALSGALVAQNTHEGLIARVNALESAVAQDVQGLERRPLPEYSDPISLQLYDNTRLRAEAVPLSAVQARLDQHDLAADHETEPAPPDSRSQADAPQSSQVDAPDVTAAAAGDGGQAQQLQTPVADIPVADIPAAPEPVAIIETTALPPAKPAPLPNAWTAAEDDKLVEGVVGWMQTGMTMNRAAEIMAPTIGRPVEGTKYRCKAVLRERIDAALTAAILAAAEPAPTATAAPSDDLTRHLSELRRKGSWTVAQDIEMLELMHEQWTMHSIAAAMQLDGAELKRSWDALSDLREADEGRKTRSFTAAQLLAALKPQQAA